MMPSCCRSIQATHRSMFRREQLRWIAWFVCLAAVMLATASSTMAQDSPVRGDRKNDRSKTEPANADQSSADPIRHPVAISVRGGSALVEGFASPRFELTAQTDDDHPVAVTVDGVTIQIINQAIWNRIGKPKSPSPPVDVDVLVLDPSVRVGDTVQSPHLEWIRQTTAETLVVTDDTAARALAESLSVPSPKTSSPVLAVVASDRSKTDGAQPRIAWLETADPISGELRALFDAMEASCEASAKIFEPLTADQLNFRPPNGTHTPRWNAEHMMGRQMLFFSQIYHALDPIIPVVDWNPRQMPDDYRADQPEWSGSEEAERMRRVSRFCRRFASLLTDVDLDERAPGSRWTLRRLLRQMDRHYDEHTANVIKKQQLPEWPTPP